MIRAFLTEKSATWCARHTVRPTSLTLESVWPDRVEGEASLRFRSRSLMAESMSNLNRFQNRRARTEANVEWLQRRSKCLGSVCHVLQRALDTNHTLECI